MRELNIDLYDGDGCYSVGTNQFQADDGSTQQAKLCFHPNFLSPELLQITKRPSLDFFIFVTLRTIYSMYNMSGNPKEKNFYKSTFGYYESLGSESQIDVSTYRVTDFLLTEMVKNIEAETKKKCLAVSTPDDHSVTAPDNPRERCGYGYRNFFVPYETSVKAAMEAKKDFPDMDFSGEHQPLDAKGIDYWLRRDKNKQLLQVIAFLRSCSPDVTLHLKFFDDSRTHIDAAKELASQLPLNITFKIYYHAPQKNIFADLNKPEMIIDTRLAPLNSSALVAQRLRFAPLGCSRRKRQRENNSDRDDAKRDHHQLPSSVSNAAASSQAAHVITDNAVPAAPSDANAASTPMTDVESDALKDLNAALTLKMLRG